MKQYALKTWNIIRHDHGGEVIEYALIAGMIVALSFVPISCFGIKVLARWNSVSSSM